MTSETKVGLLVGLGVILLVGIILTDQLSEVQTQRVADLSRYAHTPGRDAVGPAIALQRGAREDMPTRRTTERATGANDRQAQQGADQSDDQPRVTPQRNPLRRTPTPIATRNGDGIEVITFTGDRPRADGPDESATTRFHTVKQGQNLTVIARIYYGDGQYWRIIKEHNESKVGKNGEVRAGVRLVIPDRNAGNGASASNQAPRAPRPTRGTYTVRSGDTLSGIAGRLLGNSARWNDIYEANRNAIDNPDALEVGTELKIPAR